MTEKEIKKEEKVSMLIYSIHPKRDWMVILISFLVIFIGVLFYDYSFYSRASGGEMYISVNKDELKLESLNIDALKKVLQDYKDKSQYITDFKSVSLVDPSL